MLNGLIWPFHSVSVLTASQIILHTMGARGKEKVGLDMGDMESKEDKQSQSNPQKEKKNSLG